MPEDTRAWNMRREGGSWTTTDPALNEGRRSQLKGDIMDETMKAMVKVLAEVAALPPEQLAALKGDEFYHVRGRIPLQLEERASFGTPGLLAATFELRRTLKADDHLNEHAAMWQKLCRNKRNKRSRS